MRVLVTGSSGFVGAAVRRVLEARGHTLVPFDHPHDVRDRASLVKAARHVDGIINLAGVLGTAELLGGEYAAVETNVLGAVNVLDAAAEHDVPVVQIGTGHKGQPNPYAVTKACAEDLALARARWRGERVTVVRAFHAYGPGQKPCPPHGTSPVRKVVPSLVCRALSGMPLQVHGSGRQRVDLVYVDEVAAVLVDALAGPYGTVLEAGTGKPTTVLDAALDIIDRVDQSFGTVRTMAVEHLPMREGEPPETTVVASAPACATPWPYRLGETVAWYADLLARR
jgi:UDP-glucose 4-epimerase